MSKKPKPKKQGVRELLDLLGGDPEECVPSGIKEAKWQAEEQGADIDKVTLDRCSTSGKVCFTSEKQAKGAAKRRLKKGSNTSKLRVFHCPDCHSWHMSSSFRRT